MGLVIKSKKFIHINQYIIRLLICDAVTQLICFSACFYDWQRETLKSKGLTNIE